MSVLSPEADMLIFGIDVCFAPKAVIRLKVPSGRCTMDYPPYFATSE